MSSGGDAARSIASAAGLIAATTLLARLAGFARVLVFADSVGHQGVGNVYQSVNALPNVLFEVAAGGVMAAVAIPLIAGHVGAGRGERADQTTDALLTWVLVVLLPLAVVLALAAPALAHWLLQAQGAAAVTSGTAMLLIFAPQVVLYGVGIVLTGHLQAHRRFLWAALAPLLSSLVVIATYLAYRPLAEGGVGPAEVPTVAQVELAVGTTLGVAALCLPLIGPSLRTGWRYRPRLGFASGDTRRVRGLAGAGLLALLAQQTAVVATIWLSNHRGGDGTFTVYQYVQAVYLLPYAVFAVPVATSAFPVIAQAAGGGTTLSGTLSGSLRAVLVLTGAGAAVLIAVARPVEAFFSLLDRTHGPGTEDALSGLSESLVAFAPGLVGFGVAALLTRALYVRGRPLHAAAAVGVGWLLAASLPFALLPAGAGAAATLRALGIGSSVGMTVSALLLAVLVSRAWGPEAVRGALRTTGVVVVGVAVAAALGEAVAYAVRVAAQVALGSLAGAVALGLLGGFVALLVFLGVAATGDRDTMRTALRRGRAARRREA
jgi:putative peptidoglycan lipid II flippase